MFPYGKTATVTTPGEVTVDEYGDPVAGPGIVDYYEDVGLSPVQSNESSNRGRAGIVVGWQAFFPPHSNIDRRATVEIDGIAYEVDGDPAPYPSPLTGWYPGDVVNLRRAEG